MRDAFSVRLMERTDILHAAALEKKLFSDAWSETGIAETLNQSHTVCFAAKSEARLCGYLLVYYVLDECEIARIGVAFDMRRQGVASSLIRELETFCASQGIVRILLDVRESNTGARRFYGHCGFIECGARKAFYREPVENAVLMIKDLDTGNASQ